MTDPRSRPRRAVVVAAVLVLAALLAGCGNQAQGTVALSAGDRSAIGACVSAVASVDHALDTVVGAENGSLGRAAAGRRLSDVTSSLRAAADGVTDGVVQQSLQDVIDSIRAYLAVLPDRSISGYDDAVTDTRGRLAGFRRICPVDNGSFDSGISGWAPISPSSDLSQASAGRGRGHGLVLVNRGKEPSVVGATDSAAWVDRTWRGVYRAGLWARAETGTPELTLMIQEKSRSAVVGEARTTVRLGVEWTFVGVSHNASGAGGPLEIRILTDELAAGMAVHLDDVAVARG